MRNSIAALAAVIGLASAVGPATAQVLMKNRLGEVTADDFTTDLQRVPEEARSGFLQSAPRVVTFTENLLIVKSLAGMARADGLDKDPMVQKRLELAREKALAEIYRVKFEADKAAELKSRAGAFEAAAREQYQVEREKHMIGERVRVAHILIRSERKTDADARAKAEAALKRVQAGESFATVARDASEDDGTAHEGGELPALTRDKLQQPFAEAAFALQKPGDMSGLVKTVFGYHIIQLKEKLPPRQLSFDEVKDDIATQQREKFVNQAREEMYRSFFGGTDFRFDREALEAERKRRRP